MREWNLATGDPLSLTLCADARLANTAYTNDQCWEVVLGGGEPPALAVQTTYGLRARLMRIFPRFIQGSQPLSDPALFATPPVIRAFFPNYLRLAFAPFSGLDVICEYWVPASQTLAGRIRITNASVIPRLFRFELIGLLTPLGEGAGMSATAMPITTTLQGQTGSLSPVLFMTGGPEAGTGTFPSLATDMDLSPGSFRQLTWALSTLGTAQESFEDARRATARAWEAELARIEITNAACTVEIETGDPDWDAALAFSQKTAWSLLLSPTEYLPQISFAAARYPDTGYSIRGDGSDYSHLWNGQSALDTWFLIESLLPGGARIAEGLLANFLATQDGQGSVDCKPGLAGQRGRFIAPPLLSSMAWRIYQSSQNLPFLKDCFPRLLKFDQAWFSALHDRDGDGYPEWDHPFQTGFEDNPAFDRLHEWGQGLDIGVVEDPSLGALLVREVRSLEQIAQAVGTPKLAAALQNKADAVRKQVEATWDGRRGAYRYRDRDTHLSTPAELLGTLNGTGTLTLNKSLKNPQRLLIALQTRSGTARSFSLVIHGATARGPQVEEIAGRSLVWANGRATLTSRYTYTSIDSVDAQGLFSQDTVTLSTPDYTQDDITLLLPLWAHSANARRAEVVVKKSLLDEKRYCRAFGLPASLPPAKGSPENGANPAGELLDMRWNALMLEGLLAYGYRAEAAALFSRLVPAAVQALKFQQAFYGRYHAETGSPAGNRHALQGILPTSAFMDILGVTILAPDQVMVNGPNPFPWDVTLRYRGLEVRCHEKQVTITFPDGQSTSVSSSGSHRVTMG